MIENPGDEISWKNAAVLFGEHLSPCGPSGYYEMNAYQWLRWARFEIEKSNQFAIERFLNQKKEMGMTTQNNFDHSHNEEEKTLEDDLDSSQLYLRRMEMQLQHLEEKNELMQEINDLLRQNKDLGESHLRLNQSYADIVRKNKTEDIFEKYNSVGLDPASEIFNLWFEISYLRAITAEAINISKSMDDVAVVTKITPELIEKSREYAKQLVCSKFPRAQIQFNLPPKPVEPAQQAAEVVTASEVISEPLEDLSKPVMDTAS